MQSVVTGQAPITRGISDGDCVQGVRNGLLLFSPFKYYSGVEHRKHDNETSEFSFDFRFDSDFRSVKYIYFEV